jgi:hypothetical protein
MAVRENCLEKQLQWPQVLQLRLEEPMLWLYCTVEADVCLLLQLEKLLLWLERPMLWLEELLLRLEKL